MNRGDSIKRRHHRSGSGRSNGGNNGKGRSRPRPTSEYCTQPTTFGALGYNDRNDEDGGGSGGCSNEQRALGEHSFPVGQAIWTDASVGEAGSKPVKVLVMGEEGVGKTAILQQFMTSEYMAAVQTNFGLL